MSQQNLPDPYEGKPTSVFVWLYAIAPLTLLAIELLILPTELNPRILWLPQILLLGIDAWRIRNSFYRNPNSGEVISVDPWMVIGVFLLAPLYMFRRARVVGDGYWYAIMWIASLLAFSIIPSFVVDEDANIANNSDIAVTRDAESIPTSTPRAVRSATTSLAQRTPEVVPTSRPKPTSTPRPRYTPTPSYREYGRTRNQPMPVGKPIEFTDGTVINVESVTQNANQMIKRHDAWTEPPPSGHQFLLVNIKVSNQGNEPIDIYWAVTELSLVGKSNVSYDQGIECWTYPNELDINKTIFPGGSLSGNICFTVKSSDVDSLVMYYETFNLLGDDEYVYWALE